MGRATIRLSLKTIAWSFPSGSVERVYLHGMWQRERGRQPTLLYGNHTNPRLAFASAQLLIGPYIESVRKIPFSRTHDWSNWVEKIMNRVPVDQWYQLDDED